ncbi:disease resistance protein rpp13 [Quercus suber]|uniref:Disease resistance protein rpp13 n=1 Tax=Quercus suber TaxID=58331 RepID=A0AAW0JRL3_QUESU
MSNLEIDRVSMDIEVIVPLLSQKLGYLLAPEGNIYSSSTEQDRITETKSVLDRISTKIRVAGNNWASSDPAGLSRTATDPHTQPTQPRNVEDQAPDDSDFVGLEDKKDELLEKLFYAKDQESDNVIAVTGNAGSGKTVLTKKIYYGQYVKRGFNHRAWVGISEDFEAREVLLNILMELGWKRKDEILSDNDLEMMLKSYLKEKRCLIVVDDVRTHYDWEKLSVILKCVGGWSRLILTTRNIDIAHAANPWRNPIVLRSLTDDESWTLFLKKAQIENDSLNSQDLIHLKEDILKKCGGSPLAIIVLGGLLSTTELSGWPKVIEQLRKTDLRESSTVTKPAVQQSSTTDIRESSTVSKPAVRQLSTTTTSVPEPAYQENIITFSYQNLPSRMKLCVLYFGLFPRASEIRIRRLFHLWLAEGLVIPLPKDEMATEDPAEKYLQLLIERKLIKKEKMRLDGSPKTCSMPGGIWDVFHKMAVDLRRFNDISTACKSAESPNIRRLVKDPNTDNHSFFDPYNKNYSSLVHHIQNLRSYPNSGSLTKLQTLWGLFIGSEDLVENFLSKLTDLRKLKLTCTPQSECAIAEWILSKLKNLQSLKLRSINEFGRPSTLSLNAMEEHQKLCDLYLLGQLPEEAQLQFPPNLKILTLSGSQLEKDPMPILGQLPHLEILRLLRDSYSGTRMTCLDSGFPELRKLKLWMLNNLEEWIVNNGSMPRLEELEIRHCVKWKQPGLDLTNNLEKVKKVILTNMRREFVANVEKAIGQGKVKEVTLPLKIFASGVAFVDFLHWYCWVKWIPKQKNSKIGDRIADDYW